MSGPRPALVVLAERGDGLRDLLRRRTLAWASGLGEVTEVRAGDGAAARAALAAAPGRTVAVLVAAAPRAGRAHGEAALGDLDAGAEVVVGAGLAGGWYLLAAAAPRAELLLAEDLSSPRAIGRVLAAAGQARIEVGMLRPERVVTGPADLRALRADPLTPPDVRAAAG